MARHVFFLFILVAGSGSEAFNLEPRLPVVKFGEQGSYFGFSVAQHRSGVAGGGSSQTITLLVGAPRAESGQEGTRQAGALFSCRASSSHDNDCSIVDLGRFDDGEPGIGKFGFRYNASNGWMGVSIAAQQSESGGSVLACAHLYHKSVTLSKGGEQLRLVPGACFSFDAALRFRKVWEGCDGLSYSDPDKAPHELFGQCLQGVSAHIDADSNAMLMGAPGSLDWTGMVLQHWIARRFGEQTRWRMSASKSTPTLKDSYLGMSVLSGRFLGERSPLVFASGAPRSHLCGEVVFFVGRDRTHTELHYIGKLRAGAVGAQFGYSLAKVDADGDGYEDLFVGAPYDSSGRGAVYGYRNRAQTGVAIEIDESTLADSAASAASADYRLEGASAESRFGLALANAGDLNRDGYEELAVGAPYDGQGRVFIFQGSRRGLLADEASQALDVEQLPGGLSRRIRTLGYSLSGGVDVDGNGYPDLLVGALDSDAALLFLARPVIGIDTDVRGLPPRGVNASGEPCRGSVERICFRFKACLRLRQQTIPERSVLRAHV